MRDVDDALKSVMFHLRMNSLGLNATGTPGRIDEGWANLVKDGLANFGFRVVPIPDDELRAAGWLIQSAALSTHATEHIKPSHDLLMRAESPKEGDIK